MAWVSTNLEMQEGRGVATKEDKQKERVGVGRRRVEKSYPSDTHQPGLSPPEAIESKQGFHIALIRSRWHLKKEQNQKPQWTHRVRLRGCELRVNVAGKKSVLLLQLPVRAQSSDIQSRFDESWRRLKRLCNLPHFYFPGGCVTGPGLSAEPSLAFSVPFTVNDAVIVTRHHPCFLLRVRNERKERVSHHWLTEARPERSRGQDVGPQRPQWITSWIHTLGNVMYCFSH